MQKQFAKDGAKIGQLTACIESFQKAHTPANMEALNPRQLAGIVIIEQDFIRLNFFRQQNGADFPKAQRVLFLGRHQVRPIAQRFHFDPRGARNFRRSRRANSNDDHFMVNFWRDVNAWIEPMDKAKAAKLGENYQRRRICYEVHALR
jgi:hypothetical protein